MHSREKDLSLFQQLKDRLLDLVEEKKGDLADPHVVAASQELDRIVVRIQRMEFSPKKC